MGQEQKAIPVAFKNGEKGEAVSTGNNAAWHCRCSKKTLLIGRSGALKGPTDGTVVQCSTCGSRYFVEPLAKDQGAAQRVSELDA